MCVFVNKNNNKRRLSAQSSQQTKQQQQQQQQLPGNNKEIKEYESLITCVCTDSMRACFTVCWHALRRHSNFRDVWLALVCLWCGFRCSKCWKATLAACMLLPSARTARKLCLARMTRLFASGAPNPARCLIDQRRACHCSVLSLC